MCNNKLERNVLFLTPTMTMNLEREDFNHLLCFCCDQVQHIVTETRDKIMQYKSKIADEADLRRRLANLEESVELHEHMKRQVTYSRPHGQFCFLELSVTWCFHFIVLASVSLSCEWSW